MKTSNERWWRGHKLKVKRVIVDPLDTPTPMWELSIEGDAFDCGGAAFFTKGEAFSFGKWCINNRLGPVELRQMDIVSMWYRGRVYGYYRGNRVNYSQRQLLFTVRSTRWAGDLISVNMRYYRFTYRGNGD